MKNVRNITVAVAWLVCSTAVAQAPVSPGFDIENTSSSPLTAAFAKPAAARKWGSPLPDSAVPAGKTATVKVASETNCLYDVKLVFADGHEESHHNIDVCKHEHVRTAKAGR